MSIKVFGRLPRGSSLERIQESAHFENGYFQNIHPTVIAKDGLKIRDIWAYFTAKGTKPPHTLPSVKTDLRQLPADETSVTWFGHSSYLIRTAGMHILVDPVFSGFASPIPVSGKSFKGSDVYTVADMPPIDVLIITHDHYDHMDFKTIMQLDPKLICTSLGVGAHLRHWEVDEKKIVEFDWWESQQLADGVQLTATPARHFSGRGLTRFKTLWSSFVLQSPQARIFIGSDSGYDDQFTKIGQQFGPFDIALLECGQYNEGWPQIHMMPEETVQAAADLQAKVLMPVHWGKFALSLHTWDEPIKRLTARAKETGMPIATPKIGETVVLGRPYPQEAWWLKV